MWKCVKVFYITFSIIIIISQVNFSQTFNLQSIPSNKTQLAFQFDKIFYSNYSKASTLSGVYQLSCNIPISSKFNINGSIPFIFTKYDIDYGFGKYSYDKSGIGNIYLGLQTNSEPVNNKKSIISFGLFLPTANEDASYMGLYSNYNDIQKFAPNVLGFYFNYAYHHLNPQGFNYGFELGPNIFIPTKGDRAEVEVFLHYGLNAGYVINKLSLNMELLGIAIVTEDFEDFSDRFVHMVNFGASWKEKNVMPKLFFKLYIKEHINEVVDGVLGIGVTVSLN